jgi:hypothetical protein
MYLHTNAKLGLAGRFALVTTIEQGMTLNAAAAAFSVSPATAHRWSHRWLEASAEARVTLSCLLDRFQSPTPLAAAARTGARAADRRVPAQDRLGPSRGRRRNRLRALDCLEGAEAGRHLSAPACRQGAGEPLRVALSRLGSARHLLA